MRQIMEIETGLDAGEARARLDIFFNEEGFYLEETGEEGVLVKKTADGPCCFRTFSKEEDGGCFLRMEGWIRQQEGDPGVRKSPVWDRAGDILIQISERFPEKKSLSLETGEGTQEEGFSLLHFFPEKKQKGKWQQQTACRRKGAALAASAVLGIIVITAFFTAEKKRRDRFGGIYQRIFRRFHFCDDGLPVRGRHFRGNGFLIRKEFYGQCKKIHRGI